jgi:hypothetical protein
VLRLDTNYSGSRLTDDCGIRFEEGVCVKRVLAFSAVLLLSAASTAQAAIHFVDLGTGAPTGTVGQYSVAAFSTVPQAAIPNTTVVTTIPGNPLAGSLTVSPGSDKRTVPGGGWATWSHGYAGPVFHISAPTATLTLPPSTGAFSFFAEQNSFSTFTISATTNTGVTSGPVNVVGNAGANGFAFYTTNGESIATIIVTTSDTAFAMAEFGIAAPQFGAAEDVPTLSPLALIALAVALSLVGLGLLKARASV